MINTQPGTTEDTIRMALVILLMVGTCFHLGPIGTAVVVLAWGLTLAQAG